MIHYFNLCDIYLVKFITLTSVTSNYLVRFITLTSATTTIYYCNIQLLIALSPVTIWFNLRFRKIHVADFFNLSKTRHVQCVSISFLKNLTILIF